MKPTDAKTADARPTDAEYEQLLEIAYFALDERLFDDAASILGALAQTRPDKPYPRIGLALLAYARGDRDAAIGGLRAVLASFPDAVFTRSMLAQLLKDSNQLGWERYAHEALERTSEGVAADIARRALGTTQTSPSISLSTLTTLSPIVAAHAAAMMTAQRV